MSMVLEQQLRTYILEILLLGLQAHITKPAFFMDAGDQTQVLMIIQQTLYLLSILSSPTCKYLMHFKLTLESSIRQQSSFTLVHIDTLFSQHHSLNILSSSLIKDQLTIYGWIYFRAVYSSLLSLFYGNTRLCD